MITIDLAWLEQIRPWILPIVAIITFAIAITPKLRRWVIGSLGVDDLKLSIARIERSIEKLGDKMESETEKVCAEIKDVRAEMKEEHAMLYKAFTDHLIHLHGKQPQ